MESSDIENVLEIVKVNNNNIYFRTNLNNPGNGHICNLWGIATYIGDNLFLHEGDSGDSECKLAIDSKKKYIEFIDGYANSSYCGESYCGRLGGFNIVFDKSKRMPIKYMNRLKNSHQYKESVEKLKK